jgi:hypothetical protein
LWSDWLKSLKADQILESPRLQPMAGAGFSFLRAAGTDREIGQAADGEEQRMTANC